MHHALNGFEVHLMDLRGFGFSGGTRCKNYSLYDSHENIGAMLQRFRNDKPAFLMGHSMGCLITQTFLLKNPNINLAGVIYAAPFFAFAKHAQWGLRTIAVAKIGDMTGGELLPLNPTL